MNIYLRLYLSEAISSGNKRSRKLFPTYPTALKELSEEEFVRRLEQFGFTLGKEYNGIEDFDSTFEYLRYRNRKNGKREYIYDRKNRRYFLISQIIKAKWEDRPYRVCATITFDDKTNAGLYSVLMLEGDETELIFKYPKTFTDLRIYDRLEMAIW